MIRVVLPHHLQTLARSGAEVQIHLEGASTVGAVLDELERQYPMLRGTIRDHTTKKRRPFLRFYLCGKDYSLESWDAPLPPEIVSGKEPFLVIGAIAGG